MAPGRSQQQRSAPIRRQERGRRRIAEILDAAEEVIAEVGFEEATTNAIAARAGVSPGSLYQFFANKEQILDGLLPRYTESSRDFWNSRLNAEVARLPLAELLDRVVEAMAAFKVQRPAFWVLFHGSPASPRLTEVAEEVRAGIAARVRDVFAIREPQLPDERLELLATVSIAIVRGVFPLAMAADEYRRAQLLAEVKGALLGYLGPVVGYGAVADDRRS
ncbi:TetR/AcrR family transcriptional regulator [Salinactinospora qingdaonensis]|uniref:TetR/AcrR family transcriptional regulator n=1 Tax=Salinactinospora qingdaonensis TaxID=702744 RepID=A0ABP7FIQ6_9ACTN